MQGGAMYALERGLNMKWLGMIFAVFAGFASFGIGCATQVNAIAEVCNNNLEIEPWVVGFVVAVLTAFVIFGGLGRLQAYAKSWSVYGALLCDWVSDHSGNKS